MSDFAQDVPIVVIYKIKTKQKQIYILLSTCFIITRKLRKLKIDFVHI